MPTRTAAPRATTARRDESASGTYTYQLRAFVAAVRGKPELCIGLADAIGNMRVIDAVYEKAGLKPRGC